MNRVPSDAYEQLPGDGRDIRVIRAGNLAAETGS